MRGTRSSPIPIDDSEEEVVEELSAGSTIDDNLSTRLMDPPSETYALTSHKRKHDEIRTDYSDAFIQGSSSMPLAPVVESKKARKRRRRLELKVLEAEMLARSHPQQSWTPTVPYGPTGGYNPNMNMNMTMFHGIDSIPIYSLEDNTVMHNVPSGPSEWVSAMALVGSLPDLNGYSNQYQWPPPNGHPYSHNLHVQPFAPSSRSPSPPALLERVSSPILPTTNRPLPTGPHAHPITTKRSAQIIGMRPDNDPQSKHGTFRFGPDNLSFLQNNSHAGNLTITDVHSYIPNPACTIVMEQLPKQRRMIEFVQTWAKQSSGVMPLCILIDVPSAKALVEFPSAKYSRKAWKSPRLGAEYAGLKTHQLKGKPRVDQIRVWWYRVEGVGAGAGVGEMEEGEIGEDEVDASQEQQVGHQTKQQQKQGQQDPPRRPESKKARKARLAREKQVKQALQSASLQRNRNLNGAGLGHNLTSSMTDLHNGIPLTLSESSFSPHRSPQLPRPINWKILAQLDLQVDQRSEVSRSALSHQHYSSSSFGNNPNAGNAGILTPISTDARGETGPRHWFQDADVTVDFNPGENSIVFSEESVREPGDTKSACTSKRQTTSSVADQVSAVTVGGDVTSTSPPSPSSSNAANMIPLASSPGASLGNITQSISKPFSSSGPNFITGPATTTSAIIAPSFRTLPKMPLSPLTSQLPRSDQPRLTVPSVSTAHPLELALKEMTQTVEAKTNLNPVPVAVSLDNSMPTTMPRPIPSLETRALDLCIATSEHVSSDEKATPLGSTKLAEMKRALMAKQKDLEETIARRKLEMSRLKESAGVGAKEDGSVSSTSPSMEGSRSMEDRLRKLVLQSHKPRTKSTEHPQSALPQSRSSSTSSSGLSSAIPSPHVLTPPPDNVVHSMSPVQTFTLEDLAVSFITETISTLKQTATPTLVSSPTTQHPSISLAPLDPIFQPQSQDLQSRPQSRPQLHAPTRTSSATIKEELATRQKQLEQYIAESKVLMTQLTQARTKQEKDRLLGLMREKTRLMDEEKAKMANVASGTEQSMASVAKQAGFDEHKRLSKPVPFVKWPTCSLDGGILVISDDEYDEDEEG